MTGPNANQAVLIGQNVSKVVERSQCQRLVTGQDASELLIGQNARELLTGQSAS